MTNYKRLFFSLFFQNSIVSTSWPPKRQDYGNKIRKEKKSYGKNSPKTSPATKEQVQEAELGYGTPQSGYSDEAATSTTAETPR